MSVVARWPYAKWRRYRAYYAWWRRNEFRLHGFTFKDEEKDDDDEPAFWVERAGESNPFRDKAWTAEHAEAPR